MCYLPRLNLPAGGCWHFNMGAAALYGRGRMRRAPSLDSDNLTTSGEKSDGRSGSQFLFRV